MLFDEVKISLRLTKDNLDTEIQEYIDSALAFIENAGVTPDTDKPLIKTAVKDYCRWKFDYDHKGDDYHNAFDDLLKTMTLSGEYKL